MNTDKYKCPQLPGYYSVNQVMDKLSMSREGVLKLIKREELKAYLIDSYLIITEKDLNKFIQSREGITDNRYKVK